MISLLIALTIFHVDDFGVKISTKFKTDYHSYPSLAWENLNKIMLPTKAGFNPSLANHFYTVSYILISLPLGLTSDLFSTGLDLTLLKFKSFILGVVPWMERDMKKVGLTSIFV